MYVLDTNILKAISGPRPAQNVLEWYKGIDETDLFISVISIMEQRQGIENKRKDNTNLADEMDAKFSEMLELFYNRILPIDSEVAQEWGRMRSAKDKHVMDLSLAAAAKVKKFTVVTRNVADFVGRGVRVLDPYKNPPSILEPK